MNRVEDSGISDLNESDKTILRKVAHEAIAAGLEQHSYHPPDIESCPDSLKQPGACFVTLTLADQLRGCIGTLNAHRALIDDVAHNAYAAAFSDPRFPPLTAEEYREISLSISVLSKPEPMDFKDEADLIAQIKPGVDGLVIEEHNQRGTFLPSVWESLPDTDSFLQHLKRKAGLPPDYWSNTIKVSRYHTFSF